MDLIQPFIHLIKTPFGKYFYDVNRDEVYKVNDSIFEALIKIQANNAEVIDDNTMVEINKMREIGLLKNNKPQKIKNPLGNFMDYYLNHKLGSLTLQVTQNCNFRCEYCVYGQNSVLNRSHSRIRMTYDIAKQSVDFLLNRSRNAELVSIGFYGGEPLLEFKLIRQIVEYAKKVFVGKHLRFNMTTNCSLINNEVVDFLYLHSFNILISLDGPKNLHDSKRVFAVNGCGTFDLIMEKLRMVKLRYPEYYKNNIRFNTVVDPSKEFDCINQMYISNDLLNETQTASYSLIDDSYSVEKNTYSDVFRQQRSYEEFKNLLFELGKIDESKISAISRQRIAQEMELKKTLGTGRITEEMSHGGPCIIGRKTFVDVKGNLLPCERVSELSECMQIGNIQSGFDMDKVDKLMNVAQLTESQCKDCWAITRCHMCARYADNGSSLSAEKILQGCDSSKYNFDYNLRRYIAIKEIYAGGII